MLKWRRGFTIVEILVVISILAAMAVFGLGSFRLYSAKTSNQAAKTHAENWSQLLISMYDTGMFKDQPLGRRGHYPSVEEMLANDGELLKKLLSIYHEGEPTSAQSTKWTITMADSSRDDSPINHTPDKDWLAEHAQTIFYQPLQRSDDLLAPAELCFYADENCSSFRLFYITDASNVRQVLLNQRAYKIEKVTPEDLGTEYGD